MAAASVALLIGCASQPVDSNLVGLNSRDTVVKPDPRIARSSAALAELLDRASPGCSAAVAVRGAVVWADALGTADLASGAALSTASQFDIASLSKQFTATAILLLQREGALSLSDPVGTYVDGLPRWSRSITLDALMHHTSHIPDYWVKLAEWGFEFTTPATQADALRAIAAESTLEKGDGYLYSNSNYILLAEVVQRVSGQSLAQFLDSRIFSPLALDMRLDPSFTGPELAVSYDDDTLPTRAAWAFYGAYGVVTTPSELARWGDQYRDSEIVGDIATNAVDSGKPGEPTEGRQYGAGIHLEFDGSLRHDGRLGGYITTMKVSPDRETTVVVMCNGHLVDRFGVAEALWDIWVGPQGD